VLPFFVSFILWTFIHWRGKFSCCKLFNANCSTDIDIFIIDYTVGSESLDRRSNPLEQLPHWVVTSLFAAVGGIFFENWHYPYYWPYATHMRQQRPRGVFRGRGGEKEGWSVTESLYIIFIITPKQQTVDIIIQYNTAQSSRIKKGTYIHSN